MTISITQHQLKKKETKNKTCIAVCLFHFKKILLLIFVLWIENKKNNGEEEKKYIAHTLQIKSMFDLEQNNIIIVNLFI